MTDFKEKYKSVIEGDTESTRSVAVSVKSNKNFIMIISAILVVLFSYYILPKCKQILETNTATNIQATRANIINIDPMFQSF